MKKVMAIALLVMLLFTSVVTVAHADYSYYGVVVCTNLSVRYEPNTNAKRYGQLHNGDVVKIYQNQGNWLMIDLGFSGLGDGVGYIKSALVKESPCFIVLTKYTNGYDDPWYTGMENGEFSKGEPMLVKNQNDQFYCVQPHKGQAGSSFIRRSDVGRYSQDCEPGWAVVMDGPINVYDLYSSAVIGQLKTYSIVQVVSYSAEWSHIYFKNGDSYVDAWVQTSNIGPVIN